MLRELDAENLDLIVAERVPEEGIGAAARMTREGYELVPHMVGSGPRKL